jgi:hypothetical protein
MVHNVHVQNHILVNVVNQVSEECFDEFVFLRKKRNIWVYLVNRPRTCNPSPCGKNGQCISTKDGNKCVCKNNTTGVLCEQKLMPKNYRWCPIDCRAGTSCIYEGNTPTCRAL